MRILVIWKKLSVGGINSGWRNRAIYFATRNIQTDFLFLEDYGGRHLMQDIGTFFVTNNDEEIISIINEKEYDVIIISDFSSVYPAIKESRYSGPLIIESRSPVLSYIKEHLTDFKGLTPTMIIVPTEYQKSLVSSVMTVEVPIHVVFNSIDTSVFRVIEDLEDASKLEIPDKKVIGWIGRFDRRKNWKFLMKVANRLIQERDDIEFWVIGGEKCAKREQFLEMRKELSLEGKMKWFPMIPYQVMPDIYNIIAKSGGCTFSTTLSESFGNTFMESIACGCPLVAPDISCIPELLVHNSTARLYHSGSTKSAIKELSKILDDTDKRESIIQNALHEVREKFSVDRGAEHYVKVLHSLLIEKMYSHLQGREGENAREESDHSD